MAIKTLQQHVSDTKVSSNQRQRRIAAITESLYLTSPYLREPDFRSVHPDDLRHLYELYDEHFFDGALQNCLKPGDITFRLSRRMTRSGGTTTTYLTPRKGRPRFEIAVSTTILFGSFRHPDETLQVTGIECHNRLDGLLRIMEHELVHLSEMIVWEDSSCSRGRFQAIASRLFGHTDHRHSLITPREAAARDFGIRNGTKVRFDCDGREYQGVVNRITKRATVLVPHPKGQPFSDGHRYVKFYVPLNLLEAVD